MKPCRLPGRPPSLRAAARGVLLRWAVASASGLLALNALAQTATAPLPPVSTPAPEGSRDPMQPPAAARPVPLAADGSPAASAAPRHLMVVDGTRYVIDNGRRRKVGDLLGDARIERIDDSAVLVRQGGALQRLPLYGSVQKRPATEPGALALAGPVSAAATRPARPAQITRPARPTFDSPSLPRPQRPQRPGDTP